MAAPVGHIVCALAFLASGHSEVSDKNSFIAGTSFPDIRYISEISRRETHKMESDALTYVADTKSDFEKGRRFHAYVDRHREKHMIEHRAYRFLKNGPLRTQLLKIIEDHILFERLPDQLPDQLPVDEIFGKIYDEERQFNVREQKLRAWHSILATYLSPNYWFYWTRYLRTMELFQRELAVKRGFFDGIWQNIRTIGFFIYAYYQVEKLSRDEKLRKIILDFYERKIFDLVNAGPSKELVQSTPYLEPLKIALNQGNGALIFDSR